MWYSPSRYFCASIVKLHYSKITISLGDNVQLPYKFHSKFTGITRGKYLSKLNPACPPCALSLLPFFVVGLSHLSFYVFRFQHSCRRITQVVVIFLDKPLQRIGYSYEEDNLYSIYSRIQMTIFKNFDIRKLFCLACRIHVLRVNKNTTILSHLVLLSCGVGPNG